MYTDPIRQPDGSILVPRRVTDSNGAEGDAMEKLEPDHPDYRTWDRYLRSIENPAPTSWLQQAADQAGERL